MKDYVLREDVLRCVEEDGHDNELDLGYPDHNEAFREIIKDIPAADVVEVKHGRWIDSEEDGHPSICCVCNYPVDRFFKTKFCPECGAKMTEDHHEQKE